MLMRFDPFREFDTLTQALAAGPGVNRGTLMAMDAYRDGDRVVVHLDLPGVDPESINLTVEKNVLTVTAERNWEPSESQDVIVSERRQGRFTRQLFLGESLDPDRIEASYDRGVLTLTVPVAEQAKPRKVQIVSSSESRPIETTATNESDSGSGDREGAMAGTSGR
jgi:HSP20 family protein